MIPQMHSEEIITEDFDKNIFVTIKKCQKISEKTKKSTKFYTKKLFLQNNSCLPKNGDFFRKEYLPKLEIQMELTYNPNGKTSTNIMQNLGLLPIKLQKKLIKLVYNKLLC